jgi:arsenate reductase
MTPVRILFVCTGNRARSQLAEGWARKLAPPGVEVWSAGTRPHPEGVHSLAIEVMKERGVDISQQYAKSLAEVPSEADYVIALCSEADAECPQLPARQARLAWHMPDPGNVAGGEKELRQAFREARDQIEQRVRNFFRQPIFARPTAGKE